MLGATPDRAAVALALLDALDEWLPRADADWAVVRAAWCAASRTIGAHVRTADLEGTAVDLDEDGALVVEALGRRTRVVSGDLL
jgi:biotin-(acetyl-CoA carboxylase) ligase